MGLGLRPLRTAHSYIKRRIDTPPGKNALGWIGTLFLFLEQADSVIGCLVTMLIFFRPTWQQALGLFILGTGVHYLVNMLLYVAGLKKQAG